MIRVLTAALLLATLTSGCAMSANAPVTGSIYQGAKGATTATGNALTEKVGKSCASSILGAIGL
ncbi:MAG TPA: hypothetical protein VHO25_01625, partial [Polyangiaceae bacterium]|nr:hypothetical protein [Polyangiaceae bacterium]